MLQTIRWLPDRKVIFVGDSSFGTHDLANSISKAGTLISRLRLDANLFELPPETNKSRPLTNKGRRSPNSKAILNAADECWTKVTPSHWYGAKEKTLKLSPAQVCGIEPARHNATPMGAGARCA